MSKLERRELSAVPHNYSIAELSVTRDNHGVGVVIMPLPDN